MRRHLASRIESASRDIWPIKRAVAHPPENWKGWPDGKGFALILTHDVESQKGLDRTLDLAMAEESLGFRSAFNFIPEGSYHTPAEVRLELSRRGFEVGVHDLHHDGKLYRSQGDFNTSAQRINSYLKEWKAVGFRSGFMHHNLDWAHALDVEYDMSTFDTDPFEPQPEGADTIFPFWVNPSTTSPNGAKRSGYIELPYTLTQDSTLFLLLNQPDITIWKEKLDWIAQHGGMVLINVHPDYINYENRRNNREYPLSFYLDFLKYVKERYSGEYWAALPRDAARYCREFKPIKPSLSHKKVCMLSYSFYERDNRVMRYAEALVNRGDCVDVIALQSDDSIKRKEVIQGVNVSRVQKRLRNEKNKLAYLYRLIRFLFVASFTITRNHLFKRYDVLHVHNVPDFLVFAAWFPKLLGARIILDIHDILPEFFASKFNAGTSDFYVRQLESVEKASCSFADHVIISNHLWLDTITRRSVPIEKCSAIVNHVDQDVFYSRERTRTDNTIIAIFPGGLQSHQGLDIAIRAFQKIVEEFPTAEFHIYGDGNMKDEWTKLAADLGLQEHVRFLPPLPIHEIADKIANADIGLVPKRADSFGNEAYSTKIMEFMSQGIPVVASRTKIDSYYFNDSLLAFFESGNSDDMAEKILAVLKNQDYRQTLVNNGREYVNQNSWSARKFEYFNIVDGIKAAPSLSSESLKANSVDATVETVSV
jgi:glycosyltransferase involved in cell wall biosynthesis